MDRIYFNLMQIIVETQEIGERFIHPTPQLFNALLEKDTYTDEKGVYYEICAQKTPSFLWLSFEYGKTSPRDENLTNVLTGEKTQNQRTEDEVELLNQIFCLYNYATFEFYISDSRKKKMLENFFMEKLGNGVIIKSFYKSIEEIMNMLQSVDKISFTSANNLFSANSKERQALIDLTGTDAPEQFKIEAKYKKAHILPFVEKLHMAKMDNQISNLIVRGIGNDNLSYVYNLDSFTRRIDLNVEKELSGKYNPDKIKNQLINYITTISK